MDKLDESLNISSASFRRGQLVLSMRGRDRGAIYVIVGFLGGDRLALADAKRFNVSRPKEKNPRHIRPTTYVAADLVGLIETGKDIDRGYFCQVLAELKNACETQKLEQGGRAAYGKCRQ